MRNRFPVAICLLGMLVILAGCDPEALIKSKVPQPVQESLGGVVQQQGPQKVLPSDAPVEIVSPQKGGVFGPEDEVAFQVRFSVPPSKVTYNPEFEWQVYSEADKKSTEIGKGESVKKRFPLGTYQATLTYESSAGKVKKQASFRISHVMKGTATGPDGKGLAKVDIIVTNPEGTTVLHKAQSDKNGSFAVEVPGDGLFRVSPQLEGLTFNPLHRTLKFSKPPTPLEFSGLKASIKNIRLAEGEKSSQQLEYVCPLQEVFVSFDFEGAAEPQFTEIFLVRGEKEKGEEHLIRLEEVKQTESQSAKDAGDRASKMKLQVPSRLAQGPADSLYNLRVKVTDKEERSLQAEAPAPIRYNMLRCFRNTLAEGTAFQEQGQYEQAIRMYRLMEEFYKRVDNPEPFGAFMARSTFNRGVASLSIVLSKKPGERRQIPLLAQAINDFKTILKSNRNDQDALFLVALIQHIVGNFEGAAAEYSEVLNVDPDMHGVYELRAQAYLGSEQSKNLLPAVDDFTEAIVRNPNLQELRKARSDTLKMAFKLTKEAKAPKKRTDDEQPKKKPGKKGDIDTEHIATRDMARIVDLSRFPRK